MSYPVSVAAIVLAALCSMAAAAAPPPEPADAVTTRFLPDNLPNVPPNALARSAVVEADKGSRTPSVLLGVYDVEDAPITVALLFMDLWSVGLDKIKFYEVDNASRQVIAFARLRRTAQGYIDRIDLGNRFYEFKVNAQGVTTDLVHAGPAKTGIAERAR